MREMHEMSVEVEWESWSINLKAGKEHTTQNLREKHFRTGNSDDGTLR